MKPENRKKVASAALNEMTAASEYPQLTFVSAQIVSKAKGQFEVQGNLTVRGMSKPVTLSAAVKPVGELKLEIDGDAEISLKDYGLKPPSTMLGLAGTKERMTLRFLVWAERKA